MNNTVTANELKTRGISAIEAYAKKGLETIVTVRGKEKYIVITTQEFNRLRECELSAAIIESEQDLKKGKYHSSIKKHLKNVKND
mgnify:CR=1 FL=1